MSQRLKLAYIAAAKIPGTAANSIQVMKMADALSAFSSCTLLAIRGEAAGSDPEALRRRYGVVSLPSMRLRGFGGRYGIHRFNLWSAWAARTCGAQCVLSRSIGAAALSAWLGIPTIWECHAPPQGFERVYFWLLARAPGFRRLVVISAALRRLMVARHPDVERMDVVVAHDGVDLARFANLPSAAEAKRRGGWDEAAPVAGYAGHLYAGRGIDIILACAAALPGWRFIVAGGTQQDVDSVARECAARRIGNVDLLGFVENADLPARMAVSDVLLMPYQQQVMVSGGKLDTAQWMSPLKMFEYLAMGRVVIASDLPVLREVLDESCAILLAPDRPQDWIAALRTFEANRQAGETLARSACKRVAAYDWGIRARRILADMI